MNIYLYNETNFDNNGLGFLTDVLSVLVTEELNGEYSLCLSYPLNGRLSEYLKEGNLIKCNVGNNNLQLFRIKEIEKNFATIKVYAQHLYYDLLDNFIEDASPQNLDAENLCNWILNKTVFTNNFVANSNISGIASARYVRRNPVECIMGDIKNSIVNLFGAELERDNFNINLLSRRGANKNVKLLFGKNITEIALTIDITSLYTKILPIGFDGLMLPEKYVDSPLINNYPTPKITKYEFSDIRYDPEDEDAYNTLEEAYNALRNAANALFDNGLDKPLINIKINWLELSKTQEYYNQYSALESVSLGDTITAEIFGLNYETRVIKTTYNPLTDRIETFEIGTPKPSFQNTINDIATTIEDFNIDNVLTEAKETATRLINSAMGGYVYKTQNELFIMDTDNPATAKKVWRWNLNGLGYSKNGVNGPFETAITQNGAIVADFITTGKLNTSVIEGYDALVETVYKVVDLTDFNKIKEDNNILILNNTVSSTGAINTLSISNTNLMGLYPGMTFPSEYTYPGILTMYELIFDTSQELTENAKHIYLQSPIPLRNLDNVSDEIVIENNIASVIQRIGYDENSNLCVLEEPITYYIGEVSLPTFNGTTYIYLKYFNSANFKCEYMIENEFTKNFATKSDTQAIISITDQINLQVQNKCGKDDVVNQLNISKDAIIIKGNRFLLEADNLRIDQQGNIYLSDGSKVIGGDGLLTNLQFVSSNELEFLGFRPYDNLSDGNKNYYYNIIINAEIPSNFKVVSAIITLIHSPVNWLDGMAKTEAYYWGISTKIKAYKVSDLTDFYKKAVLMSEMYAEEEGLSVIQDSFGTNGFTAQTATDDNHITQTVYSSDIKSSLSAGWNRIVLQSDDTMPFDSDFEKNAVACSKKTGSAIAILNVIGYTAFE